jgi:two-component system, LytTR family, response regulator
MKVAIIDDEADARSTLRHFLIQEQPGFEIREASTVATGIELIDGYKPDLVFLDVMMPDGTGFDLLKQLQAINFKLVIVSGHQEYALQAFRFSAIDYLVKPIDADELRETLSRIKPISDQPWNEMLEVLRQAVLPAQTADRKIVLKDMNAIYVVAVSSIIRCEASDNYTTFFVLGQAPIVVSKPLKEYDDLLAPFRFLRVHQSHLINVNHLQQFNKRDGGSIKMKDGSEVPVSSRKRDLLMDQLSKFL